MPPSNSFVYRGTDLFPTIDVDVAANKRFGYDVAKHLADGDEIVGGTVACTTTDEELQISEVLLNGTVIQARLTGFTLGRVVKVEFSWETVQGDNDNRTLGFNVVNL